MHDFYETLGLNFILEKHGDGPEHFSCKIGEGLMLELYPFVPMKFGKPVISKPYRLEFESKIINEIIKKLKDSGWEDLIIFFDDKSGLNLIDPDGNTVILIPPKSKSFSEY